MKCFPRFLLEIHKFLQRRAITPTLFSHFNVGSRIYAEIFILITEKRPNHATRGFLSPRIKVRTDWHGLPIWLLSSRRIITFILYFSSHKRDFPFLKEMIGSFVKIAFSKGWLQCFIDICFKFLNFCLEAKLTPDRDLSMMFSRYSPAFRRCLNFKRPSANISFGEFVLSNLIASPVMKPYFTPCGWHEAKCVNWKVSVAFLWVLRISLL